MERDAIIGRLGLSQIGFYQILQIANDRIVAPETGINMTADSIDSSTQELTTPSPTQEESLHTTPIPSPAFAMQYRAVGLLLAKYMPSEQEFQKGILLTNDGTIVDAVILGKVLHIAKKWMDLSQEHLWVVYPRTRDEEPLLHVQIMGIWEPETLHPDREVPALELKPDFFSIRGEVIFQNKEEKWVVVRIRQFRNPKAEKIEKMQYFKLKIMGDLPERAVKNFWNLQVMRVGSNLVIQEAERIAFVGKKKGDRKGPPRKGKPRRPSSPAPEGKSENVPKSPPIKKPKPQ